MSGQHIKVSAITAIITATITTAAVVFATGGSAGKLTEKVNGQQATIGLMVPKVTDNRERIIGLEHDRKSDHALLIEMRTVQKQIQKDVTEILKRTPAS